MTWKIEDYADDRKGYLCIVDENGGAICQLFPFAGKGGIGIKKARENAKKIVNADQLWDALVDMVAWCEEGCPEGSYGTLTEAKAALKMINVCR